MAQIIETKKSGTQQDIGKSILQSLEQIKSSYDSKIPKVDYSQVDNLPTRQVVMPTSAEIKSEATKDLENYKSASLNKINTDYYTNLQSQQTAKQNSKADLQNNIAVINNKAKQDIETLQAKSINQGIENSSIVDNQKATIAKQRIADLTSAKQQYLSKLDAINPPYVPEELKGKWTPYMRAENGTRYWAVPGREGFTHILGGLEKDSETGAISTNPENHDLMTRLRQQKIQNIQVPDLEVEGDVDDASLESAAEACNGCPVAAIEQA